MYEQGRYTVKHTSFILKITSIQVSLSETSKVQCITSVNLSQKQI